jgi:hypothetical protein
MIRKDYFLRLIEEAAALMARLLGLRAQNQYEAAFGLLDDTYRHFFQQERAWLGSGSLEDFERRVWEELSLHSEQIAFLGDLLREEAELWSGEGNWPRCQDCLQKAILLLEGIDRQLPQEYSIDRAQKRREMQARLEELRKLAGLG